jgi:hypothetical protein
MIPELGWKWSFAAWWLLMGRKITLEILPYEVKGVKALNHQVGGNIMSMRIFFISSKCLH